MAKQKPSPPHPGPGATEAEYRTWWRAQGPENDRSYCQKHKRDKALNGNAWICGACFKGEPEREEEKKP